MTYKKFIIAIGVVLGLITANCANADNANSLLKMDVKRASTADSVDVTFYTTEGAYNSVVTRKSDNRYVVLLPNTVSASSIVPSLGGVKDLISDVNVKNVDDGIGGYTKVTFTTAKPVKIQTFTKKTAPLTKAQEEYKNLIAKHESTPVATPKVAAKPATTTTKQTQTTKPITTATTSKTTTDNTKKVTSVTGNENFKIKNVVTSQVITLKTPISETNQIKTNNTVKTNDIVNISKVQPEKEIVINETKETSKSDVSQKNKEDYTKNTKENLLPQQDVSQSKATTKKQ